MGPNLRLFEQRKLRGDHLEQWFKCQPLMHTGPRIGVLGHQQAQCCLKGALCGRPYDDVFWEHDDVITWKHFARCCPFVRAILRSPLDSPRKGQGRGAVMFSLIST